MTSMSDGPHPPVMNGELDGMKSSPANGPGTPRDDANNGSLQEYSIGGYTGAQPENNVSDAPPESPAGRAAAAGRPRPWDWSPRPDVWE